MTPNILLVDDDPMTLKVLSRVLTSEAYAVECCTSGHAALELLRTQSFTLLISDYVMPDLDGVALVAEARARHPAMGCILISGRSRPDALAPELQWLSKPLSISVLLDAVEAELRTMRDGPRDAGAKDSDGTPSPDGDHVSPTCAIVPPVPTVTITGIAHVGIRVHDLERSVRFYQHLGFVKTAGPLGSEPVAILEHPSGIELNLVLNAARPDATNVLMDVPEKHPGITHISLLCPDIMAAKASLEAAGIPLSGGPVQFTPTAKGIFVRDPDRNVIELHQRG